MRELIATDDLAPILELHVAQAVETYLAEHPLKDGVDGERGEPGKDGSDGRDGKDGENGKDGKDGKDGMDGMDGTRGLDGEKGEAGKDGAGIADLLIDRDGNLIATMTDGRVKSLGIVIGRDGKDGRNGADGLSMADVTRAYDPDAHEVVERWTVGGEQKELRYPAGGIRPGGFWREGLKCYSGQAITHDGALWIAKRDNSAKPCLENADDWQLAARKGRDGRDGKDGKPPPGPVKLHD